MFDFYYKNQGNEGSTPINMSLLVIEIKTFFAPTRL